MKVTLMMAMTADGFIARHDKHLANWTSAEDKQAFVAKTKAAGVIVMGLKTFDTIGRPLPKRLNLVMALPEEIRASIPGILEFTADSPKEILDYLIQQGYQELVLGGGSTINGLFLQAGLVDEIWLTIEPKLFGAGLSLFAGLEVDLSLKLLACEKLSEQTVQLKYLVEK